MARRSWSRRSKMVLLLAGKWQPARKVRAELTQIVAHRGDRAHAPENTLAAFRCALEQGAEMIELDLQLAADGRVVVFHDFELDALTDGSGPVHERSSEELVEHTVQADRFGEGLDHRIPRFEDVLARIGCHCPLYLELKRRPMDPPTLVEAVLKILPPDAPHVLASFDEDFVRRCRRADRRCVLIADDAGAALRASDRIGGLHALSLRFGEWDSEVFAQVSARSMQAWAWTVNDRRDWWRLQALGLHAICTDDPGAAVRWREDAP